MKTCGSLKIIRNTPNRGVRKSTGIDFERTLEWARLYTTQLGGADACAQKHRQVLLEKGETRERLCQLTSWQQSTAFTKDEKAVFALCESISRKKSRKCSAADLKEVRRCFNTVEMVRLTLAILAVNDWIYREKSDNLLS